MKLCDWKTIINDNHLFVKQITHVQVHDIHKFIPSIINKKMIDHDRKHMNLIGFSLNPKSPPIFQQSDSPPMGRRRVVLGPHHSDLP